MELNPAVPGSAVKSPFSSTLGWISRAIEFVMVLCLAIMTVLVFGNVVLRYAFNSGIGISEEISRYLFVWLTFFGAVIGMRERAHLGMDSVVQHLPACGKKICLGLSELIMLGCCWLFLDGSWQQTIINLDNHAPVSDLPLAYIYGVGVFASIAIGLILIGSLFKLITGRLSEDELIQTKESEEETASLVELAHQKEAKP